MATGPEHYREAEKLLASADANTAEKAYVSIPLDEPPSALLVAAQVHATLALAAATAMGAELPAPDLGQWTAVAGAPPRSLGKPRVVLPRKDLR